MEIRRARHAGACYGVNRALGMVEQVLHTGAEAHSLGPLIHNPRVVAGLAARGVDVVSSVDEVQLGTLVIRSHGVPPQIIAAARAKGLTVLDATCPHVIRAQQAAQNLRETGFTVLVVGELGHPEVEGISAYAGPAALVVQEPSDLPDELSSQRLGIVVQTTQTPEALAEIVVALKARGLAPEVRNTVCDATKQRQEAARQLAQEVDVMLVVGGRNSGNTTRLAEICATVCDQTHHIEGPDELQDSWFIDAKAVGITAGASTPEDQIIAVEQGLMQLEVFGVR
ncbi:MAG: 4-hydroxy-3-methylbut-2-enyl diphosphate reductase [Actinomycetia bacterium]|nr:4-hydroxy-3-methylbut-2-enyl diphosphate reductase [Actinomycetes bacterium]